MGPASPMPRPAGGALGGLLPAKRALLLASLLPSLALAAPASAAGPAAGAELLLFAEHAALAKAAPGRRLGAAPGTRGEYWVKSGEKPRRYVLFVPNTYNGSKNLQLWLALPGSDNSPEELMDQAGLIDYAKDKNIAIAALQGEELLFNVEAHSQPYQCRADDVAYTAAVLRDVTARLKVDTHHISCVGFSRGGRMCSRLASELSSFISAIAPVSGLRYPKPNNATRPMPIIAFHGTKDPINPFWGHGAGFWKESIPDALHKWVRFNGCKKLERKHINDNVLLFKHTNCRDGADVFLAQVNGGGHTWPGTLTPTDLGFVSHDIKATVDIGNFFHFHRIPRFCKTAKEGDDCYRNVMWAKSSGIYQRPDWYPGLTSESSIEAFQWHFHWGFVGNCARPCPAETEKTTTRAPEHHHDDDRGEKEFKHHTDAEEEDGRGRETHVLRWLEEAEELRGQRTAADSLLPGPSWRACWLPASLLFLAAPAAAAFGLLTWRLRQRAGTLMSSPLAQHA